MNEAETRAELIDPALKAAGWGVVAGSRVQREVITIGRLQGAGKRARQDIADYVLFYQGQKLAVIEAKRRDLPDIEGVPQAKKYADSLQTRFTYSTNGDGIYCIDMETGHECYIDRYPTPDELWDATYSKANFWRNRFGAISFEDKSGQWPSRYYQHNAINKTLEAIAEGQERILLTLATGTGKTAIAFQLVWKLFHARWNLNDWKKEGEPTRRPRILFLADRNILANQAYNSFSAFPEDALVRISPNAIRKKGRVPKNGNIFFTIFQTFMTGDESEENYRDYPADFFDFIIIDECHRGGANDEGNWRGILEYFAPSVQLGLTATPKRSNNVNTYEYFGEPVYTYSLKEGINDGFLTPFKVNQIATTLDEYVYTSDDTVLEGEVEEGKLYREGEINHIIVIPAREKYRVSLLMQAMDQSQKTIVFCANQEHALAVCILINQMKASTNPNYCVRVTADDGELGERWLEEFRDNEKTIPTVLTTSHKLSTGVDAQNVRNIVLMRSVNSMIEFKQIIGRGTRLFDGKDYFTVYDFVKAYEHFNDPEWDGEPVETTSSGGAGGGGKVENPTGNGGGNPERQKVKIKLADGKERMLQYMSATTFWSPEGKPMSVAEFIERLFGELPELFKNEDELREIWSKPDTRKALLNRLSEKGYGQNQLNEIKGMINAEKSDLFDVLAYIAFALPPILRAQRAEYGKQSIAANYDEKLQVFLNFVLSQYVLEGVSELDQDKLPDLLKLKYRAVPDAVAEIGDVMFIREAFIGFQKHLYHGERV